MNVRWLVFVSILVLSGALMADDQQRVHVDIDQVMSDEDIQPVDGMRSAGQPNAAQLSAAKEAGYVAVVDMRGPAEDRGIDEAAVLDELGLEYIELPLTSAEDISFENATKLDTILADHDGPVLLHCGSGNRVGALLALRQSLVGASDEAALSYGRAAGMTGLEPVVRARLAAKQ